MNDDWCDVCDEAHAVKWDDYDRGYCMRCWNNYEPTAAQLEALASDDRGSASEETARLQREKRGVTW